MRSHVKASSDGISHFAVPRKIFKLYSFLQSSHGRRSNLDTCVVQHRRVCAIMQITSEHETGADDARLRKAEKEKTAHRGRVSLDNWGPLRFALSRSVA